MLGKRVSYDTDKKAYGYFELLDDKWLREFRAIVYRLCRNTGHYGIYSIRQDLDSGIEVQRLI